MKLTWNIQEFEKMTQSIRVFSLSTVFLARMTIRVQFIRGTYVNI